MKTIIVSGSSSGIGRSISQYLLDQGYQVIGLARNHDKFNPNHPNYKTFAIDFSKYNALEAA